MGAVLFVAIPLAIHALSLGRAAPGSFSTAQVAEAREERRVVVTSKLSSPDSTGKSSYELSALMWVRAGAARAREVMTDYHLYAGLVPYVNRSDWDPERHLIELEGGVWRFRLRSTIRVDEKADRVEFRVVRGHFTGLRGEMSIQDQGVGRSSVSLTASQSGTRWPPRFIVELGAELAFRVTGGAIRARIEEGLPAVSGGARASGLPVPSGVPQPATGRGAGWTTSPTR